MSAGHSDRPWWIINWHQLFQNYVDGVFLVDCVPQGRQSEVQLETRDVFVMDCHWIAIRARFWWDQTDLSAIHPVLRYCNVIGQDPHLIDVILMELVNRKRVGGSGRIAWFLGRLLSDCGVDHNPGAVGAVGFKMLRLRHSPLDCG